MANDAVSRFPAIELFRIKHDLSVALAMEADVTTRDGLPSPPHRA